MLFTVIVSYILFVTTSHIWCHPNDDVPGIKALIVAYRGDNVAVVFPHNSGPKSLGGTGKGGCFPRGKPKRMDERDPLNTAARELKEETGLEVPKNCFEFVASYGDTYIYLAKVPDGVEPQDDIDTHDRSTEWVEAFKVKSSICDRNDSLYAWSINAYRFSSPVPDSEFEGMLD